MLAESPCDGPETRNLLKSIQSVTGQPVRYVIITQNHGDHVGGIPLFSPPATVIVHDRVVRDWATRSGWPVPGAPGEVKRESAEPDADRLREEVSSLRERLRALEERLEKRKGKPA